MASFTTRAEKREQSGKRTVDSRSIICTKGHVREDMQRLGCRTCSLERYDRRRVLFDAIKVAIGCAQCGYSENPAALQFDHLSPETKAFHIGSQISRNIYRLMDEIEKCQVLCANCHAVKSADESRQKHGTRNRKPVTIQLQDFTFSASGQVE